VTLEKVWPPKTKRKTASMEQDEIDRLVRRLRRTEKTKFEHYHPVTGEWTFVVEDFD
jgi:hypothetical protein